MMHGQAKSKKIEISPEEQRKQEEQAQKILDQIGHFFKVRKGEVPQPEDPMAYSELLAKLCPEISTIFNYRRELITQKLNQEVEQQNKEAITAALNKEFELVTILLKRHPKSYTLWSYREWLVLESLKQDRDNGTQIKALQKEFGLCAKMLQMDERNFHVWNYRNWLNSLTDEGKVEEFTLEKIKQNFSNFSAYHFRSKNFLTKYNTLEQYNLRKANGDELAILPVPFHLVKSDLQIVQEAIFIQPKEQGVYLYHKWLIGVVQPYGLKSITLNQDSSFTLELTRKVSNFIQSVQIFVGDKQLEQNEFSLTSRLEFSKKFTLSFSTEQPQNFTIRITNRLLEGETSDLTEEEDTKSRFLVPATFHLEEGKLKSVQIGEDYLRQIEILNQMIQENVDFIQSVLDEEGGLRFALLQKASLLSYQYDLLALQSKDRSQIVTDILKVYKETQPQDPSIEAKIRHWSQIK